MKIKGSVQNLKIKTAVKVGAAGTVIALALRFYQYFGGLVDFETGFFTEESFTTPLLYGVLGVTAVAVFVICLLAGKAPQDKFPRKKNVALAALSGAFALSLAYCAVSKIGQYNNMAAAYNPYFHDGQTKLSYLMKSGAMPTLLEGAFAFLSIVFFVLLVLRFLGKNVKLTKFRFFSLCPFFWATFRMIQRFTKTISFMNVSKLFLELFMIAFIMMFFMYLAQLTSQVNNRGIAYKVVAYGIIAGMLAAVVSVPEIAVQFTGSYNELALMGKIGYPLEVVDIFFAVFSFLFVDFFVLSPKIRNMTQKESEKIIREEK